MRESLTEIERVVSRAKELERKAASTGDNGYWDGVALNLNGFYAGIERILEDIALTIDESIPKGTDWHRELIVQMSAEIPDLRPAVFSRETRECLDEYRGFRHVVRNVYTFNLNPARLDDLVNGLHACFDAVRSDLLRFVATFESLP